LFAAVPLPATAVEVVESVVQEIRAQPLPDGMRDVRWVRLDGLHLTLRFLGPTTPEMVTRTRDALARAAAATPPIDAVLEGAGWFPAAGRPRTLWIGLAEGLSSLEALARTVGSELATAGWPTDDRPFRAHLTLARCDGLAAGPVVADRMHAEMDDRRIDCTLDRLTLYETVTGGGPARYIPVAEFPLGASPVA
jgi:2'-5' RNA ligase